MGTKGEIVMALDGPELKTYKIEWWLDGVYEEEIQAYSADEAICQFDHQRRWTLFELAANHNNFIKRAVEINDLPLTGDGS
jgi:hypothetical protein